MRSIFLLFVLFTNDATAQSDYDQGKLTELNKFVLEKDIEWAIYKNDSLFTDKPDLKKMLIDKALAIKIKAYFPALEGSYSENNLKLIDKSEIDYIEYGGKELVLPRLDENGNVVMPLQVRTKIKLDEPKGELGLSQILYVKNGILKSYISRVSPKIYFITPQGIELGKGNHFSTALNSKTENFNSKNDKIIFIKKTTSEIFVDSLEKYNKLKELYGRNLIETLWPYIEKNKIKLHTIDSNKVFTLKEVEAKNLLNLQTISVPIYDNNGEALSPKVIMTEITPNVFNKITITQQWYYNETKNIVFCKIPSVILSIPKLNEADNTLHEIKIVF
jgi:hypothetical protein